MLGRGLIVAVSVIVALATTSGCARSPRSDQPAAAGYAADWTLFTDWCAATNHQVLRSLFSPATPTHRRTRPAARNP